MISHSDVLTAEPAGENLVQLTIKEFYSKIKVATMSQPVVSLAGIPECCRNSDILFLLNIPKDAFFERDIIDFAADAPFGIGGLGDLYSAITEKNFQTYTSKEVRFILRGLKQLTAVSRIERLNNRTYLIHRHQLESLLILALNEYDLTADAVREGFEKFGQSDIVLTSNPNCRPSPESIGAAKHCGASVMSWGQLLGALKH